MTMCVSANITVPDRCRVPLPKELEQKFTLGRKRAQRKRAIKCNSKASRERCDSLLKKF